RYGMVPLVGGGRSVFSVVHAANVADGAVRAALHDGAGGRAYNLTNDFDVTVREFFELAAAGLGRRVRFLRLSENTAERLFRAVKAVSGFVSGGRLRVVSDASLSFLTRDNPFTSDRARLELGWAP